MHNINLRSDFEPELSKLSSYLNIMICILIAVCMGCHAMNMDQEIPGNRVFEQSVYDHDYLVLKHDGEMFRVGAGAGVFIVDHGSWQKIASDKGDCIQVVSTNWYPPIALTIGTLHVSRPSVAAQISKITAGLERNLDTLTTDGYITTDEIQNMFEWSYRRPHGNNDISLSLLSLHKEVRQVSVYDARQVVAEIREYLDRHIEGNCRNTLVVARSGAYLTVTSSNMKWQLSEPDVTAWVIKCVEQNVEKADFATDFVTRLKLTSSDNDETFAP